MPHRFVVQLDGIDLKPDQERSLNTAIQQAALTHLATIDTGGDTVALFRPPGVKIYGIDFIPIDPTEDVAERINAVRASFEG
jgi:hypothetical protein